MKKMRPVSKTGGGGSYTREPTVLNDCLQQDDVPSWLTQGSTTFIVKDESKGAEVSNFRPITCLPLM